MTYRHLPRTLAAVLLTLLACHQTMADAPSDIEKRTRAIFQANERLEEAETELERGNLAAAETKLRELRKQPYFHEEIDQLLDQVERVRRLPALKRAQDVSAARALDEVQERAVLPSTYGETRIITPEDSFAKLPFGPMEKLADKPVSLSVEDADLRTLILTLGAIDGLNIIADDALTSDQTLSISCTDVPLREILGYVSRNMGVAFHFGKNVIWVTEGDAAGDPGPKLETRMYRLRKGMIPETEGGGQTSFAGAAGFGGGGGGGGSSTSGGSSVNAGGEDDVFTALTDFLEAAPDAPADALFRIYRNQNLVVIRNTRDNLRLAEELIQAFDRVPAQILIEARYLTIGQTDLFQLGTTIENLSFADGDFDAAVPTDGTSVTDIGASSQLPGFPTQLQSPGQLAVSGVIDRVTYRVVLEALEQAATSRTNSSPRITVFNNHTARLRRGENRFYFDEFEQQSTGGENPATSTVPSGSAQELELGVTLQVTPSVGADNETINLGISAEILDFLGFETLTDDISLPVTDENSIATVLAVNSGETVVMGGLLQNEKVKGEFKVPILGDIPGLGELFKKREKSERPTHLFIFVTATIIDPDGRFNTVSKPDRPLIRER